MTLTRQVRGLVDAWVVHGNTLLSKPSSRFRLIILLIYITSSSNIETAMSTHQSGSHGRRQCRKLKTLRGVQVLLLLLLRFRLHVRRPRRGFMMGQWAIAPPNLSLAPSPKCGMKHCLTNSKHLRPSQARSVAFKIHQNAFPAWLRLGPHWGSSRRSRRPPSRLGRGHPSPHSTSLDSVPSVPRFSSLRHSAARFFDIFQHRT